MQPFKYGTADQAEKAVATVSPNQNATYLAGGTSLIDLLKLNVQAPEQLIDINKLPLSKIIVEGDRVKIGAMARNSDVAYHETIREKYPVLSEALLSGATPQLRNMATTGGNLLQRTRCYYFRDAASPCNKRVPGSGCPAIEGYNRIHAIFGTSEQCIATHPSDMAVAMMALDAVIQVQSRNGSKRIPIADFYLVPGSTPDRETVLEHGDLITTVEIPMTSLAARSHYVKVRERASYAFATTSVAAALEIQSGVIKAARIALGGVGTKPWRALEAEKRLVGQPANENTYRSAAAAAVEGAKPQKHNEFKIELTKRTVLRALETVGEMS